MATMVQKIREKLPNVTGKQLEYGAVYVAAVAAGAKFGGRRHDQGSFKSLSTGRKVGSLAIVVATGVVRDMSYKKLKGTLGERGKLAADATLQSVGAVSGAVMAAKSMRKRSYGTAAFGVGIMAASGALAVSNLKVLMRTDSDSDVEKVLRERDARIENFGKRAVPAKKSQFSDFEELDRWFMDRRRF